MKNTNDGFTERMVLFMIYTYNLLNQEEYDIDGPPGIGICDCTRKVPINSDQRNNKNHFVFKVKSDCYSEEFAEVLSSIVGKRTIENFCDCELTKRPTGVQNYFSYGSSSFFYYSNNDNIIAPHYFISKFLKYQNRSLDCIRTRRVDIDTCLHSILYEMLSEHRSYQEYEHVKQQFIDMIVFDCKFGNDDRGINNWMLYQDKSSKTIELYPLFDNEVFLGIGDNLNNFELPCEKSLILTKNEQLQAKKDLISKYNLKLRMKTPTPKDSSKGFSSYIDILNFLLEKYPIETYISCKKISKFTFSDLETLLDEFPDLKAEYKIIAKMNFIDRELNFNKAINEHAQNKLHNKTMVD